MGVRGMQARGRQDAFRETFYHRMPHGQVAPQRHLAAGQGQSASRLLTEATHPSKQIPYCFHFRPSGVSWDATWGHGLLAYRVGTGISLSFHRFVVHRGSAPTARECGLVPSSLLSQHFQTALCCGQGLFVVQLIDSLLSLSHGSFMFQRLDALVGFQHLFHVPRVVFIDAPLGFGHLLFMMQLFHWKGGPCQFAVPRIY